MTDMDELLQRDARRWQADFQPPELAAMVATATRPAPHRARWAWPILAAVLLLAIPLVTVLLRQNHGDQHPVVHQPANPVAPGLKLLGSVPWLQAVSQPDGRSVSVYAIVDKTPGLACLETLPVLKAVAVETDSSITIEVQAYLPAGYQTPTPQPGTVSGCNAIGHHPVPLLVSLHDPIGARTLIDASTGQSRPTEPAVELPSLTRLPAGYVDAGNSATQPFVGYAQHGYRNGDTLLDLIRTRLGGQPLYTFSHPAEATGTVLGYPAKVGSYGNGPGEIRCAQWSDHNFTWQLCSTGIGTASGLLPAAQLLSAANSIR
jgi:hypothetical protein